MRSTACGKRNNAGKALQMQLASAHTKSMLAAEHSALCKLHARKLPALRLLRSCSQSRQPARLTLTQAAQGRKPDKPEPQRLSTARTLHPRGPLARVCSSGKRVQVSTPTMLGPTDLGGSRSCFSAGCRGHNICWTCACQRQNRIPSTTQSCAWEGQGLSFSLGFICRLAT